MDNDDNEQEVRERDWDVENNRNVRQRQSDERSGSFRRQVQIERKHITLKRSTNAGVHLLGRLNPQAPIISLDSLIQEGPKTQGFIVAMIMSINTESQTIKTEIQKRYNGNNRGISTQIKYNRRILFMCLKSEAGSNMFIMFQGNSKNQNIFDADLSLRDNGGIRKLLIF